MGGLVAGGAHMVRGWAGTGKTMVGLHFLTDGVQKGEKTLFITLSESEARIRRNAASTGFDLAGVELEDLTPDSQFFAEMQGYDLFAAGDIDHEPMTRQIVAAIATIKPTRIFLDSITQFRYLAADDFLFRMRVLSFLRFLLEQGSTVLFTSEATDRAPDEDLQNMGVVVLLINELETVSGEFRATEVGASYLADNIMFLR